MRISIITANYNCKPWLKECIASVRSQNYPDYEHIVLDDCSSDSSLRRLQKWAAEDPNLRVIPSDRRLFCGGAYKKLSHEANGDIIGVLDADDVLTKHSMSKISELYQKHPEVGYIWTQFWYCTWQLRKVKKGFSRPPKKGCSLLESGHCFSHWRTFRRVLLEQGEIFKDGLKSAVDKYMGYALEEKSIGGFYDVPLYKYRQRGGGLAYTGKKNWRKIKDRFTESREKNKTKIYPVVVLL